MTIQENIPLAPLTTLQVGGAAHFFAEATTEDEVREATHFAASRNLPLFVLGGGSNLVVADSGWTGLVLRIAIGGIERGQTAGGGLFDVGAGVGWDDFVTQAVRENCAGVECLSGIPGSVGGTPVQNVGAYGQEISETIECVRVFDRKMDGIVEFSNDACGFRYRTSIFNTNERDRYVILRVHYRLAMSGTPSLKYGDLKQHFAGSKAPPTLAEVREAVLQIRRHKGMLIVPGEDDCRSAGSFFKNPVLGEREFSDLCQRATARGLVIPSYPALDAQRKVSAAWLVEHSGFSKGFVRGAAGISRKHALALINRGGAKASDIICLKDKVQHGVQETWGISLEPEPVFVGF